MFVCIYIYIYIYRFAYALDESGELILNAFKNGIFPIKETQGKGLKILTPKKMLQRLPIALGQTKVRNISENLLNDGINQIVYFLYRANEITQKVYNNIMNSVKYNTKLNTIFMNSKNSKISDFHRLLLNPINKIDLRKDKYIALSNLTMYYTLKNIKKII